VQPGLLDGNVLQRVDPGRVDQAEHPADAVAGIGLGDLTVGQQL
jgi:hypothetical protein